MSDVRRTAGGIPRHQPHGAMRSIPPRSPKGPGALANFKGSMSMYSRKTRSPYHSVKNNTRTTSSTAGYQSQYIVARITSKEGEPGNHGQRKHLIPKGNRVAGIQMGETQCRNNDRRSGFSVEVSGRGDHRTRWYTHLMSTQLPRTLHMRRSTSSGATLK